MNQSDLPQIRLLAKNEAYTVSGHATQQMLNRGISFDDIENVLTSPTNQLLETQSPSSTPGKEHEDERFLIFDPQYYKAVIVICVLLMEDSPFPEIRIITAEYADSRKWKEQKDKIPSLVRIK